MDLRKAQLGTLARKKGLMTAWIYPITYAKSAPSKQNVGQTSSGLQDAALAAQTAVCCCPHQEAGV